MPIAPDVAPCRGLPNEFNHTGRSVRSSGDLSLSRWPFNQPAVPTGCTDRDAAVWHAIRAGGDGELPRQTLEAWCAEQRASRHRDRFAPDPHCAPEEISESLIAGAYELSHEARGRLLAESAPLFDRVEQMRPAVWREWLRERLGVVAHTAPADASAIAAWAVGELERIRPLCSRGEYDDGLVRLFHAARHAELLEVSR